MALHRQWHIGGWPAILLAPVGIFVAILVQLFVWLFGLKNSADLTPEDVLRYLEDFVEGRGGDWDWDDFTGIPITDPFLERIREEAASVELPLTENGRATLRQLAEQIRAR
ncbi:hypothetical protein [Sphingomonas sp.]|uniref:hypothetical protein n=1 Tax=Sphingomonas sp. TaxID=28214 RepID=UPI00286CCB46|nr:hypothetical protein [Sphingomonas sp.]